MEDLTALIPGFTTTEWIIGGHDMDYWFNELVPKVERRGTPAFNRTNGTTHTTVSLKTH